MTVRRANRSLRRTPAGRRTTRLLLGVASTLLLAAPAAALAATGAQAAPSGVVWTIHWNAPITAEGPNRFTNAPAMPGTAHYSLGKVTAVDQSISARSALPDACGTFPMGGTAALSGDTFTVRPVLACNGTYDVTVAARNGSGSLATTSPKITAPLSLADPGPAPTGFTGVAQGTSHTVVLSWDADPDPDVVGYRVRRDGKPVVDVPVSQRTARDTVPHEGTYTYDVATLRWGADGPAGPRIASPAAAPVIAHIVDGAPPATAEPAGSGGSGSSGSSSAHGGSSSAGSPAPAGGHAPNTSTSGPARPPAASHAHASLPSTRSADAKAPDSGRDPNVTATTLDDGYREHLPYQPGSARERIELTDPARTKTVSRTVPVSRSHRPGLVVPIAVVVVLLAASLQVRTLLVRSRAATPT